MEKLIPSLNEVKIIDPITISLLKSEVYSKIFRDKVKACKELRLLMKEYSENEEAYLKYWSLMKELGNMKELEEISNKILAVCSNNNVPTCSWVEGLFKHSEMLVQKGDIEEALRTLKKICFILPPMPLPRLNYIDKSLKIKDEVLENLQVAAQVPAEPDNYLNDNSLFGDENMLEGNTMNESEFLDLKILNMKQDDDGNQRVSIMSDIEGGIGAGDRSLVMTKQISLPDEKIHPVPKVNLGKLSSKKDYESDIGVLTKLNSDQR